MLAAMRRIGSGDWLAGAIVIALGAFVIYEAGTYRFGTVAAIGPGFFPYMLGVVLIVCGAGIVLVEGPRNDGARPGMPALVPLVASVAAIASFGLMVERFGLAPAVFTAALVSGFGGGEGGMLGRIGIAAVISGVSVVLFTYVLGLPFRIVTW